MSVTSARAELGIFNALGERRFTASAIVSPSDPTLKQDTPAGQSVTIRVTEELMTATGAGVPDTLSVHLSLPIAGGTSVVITFTPTFTHPATTGVVASEDFTFFFTTNGLTGGSPRSGTLELLIDAVRNTGVLTERYDCHSDKSKSTDNSVAATNANGGLPSGGSFSAGTTRGFVRGTTTLTNSVSNVSAGGATPSVFAYTTPVAADGGDSIFHRGVLAAPTYESVAMTSTVTGPTAGSLTAATNTTTTTFDASYSKVVDERFPAAVTAATAQMTVGNGSLNNNGGASGGGTTGVPYVGFTGAAASFNVDPRLYRVPLFQIDDNTFGTPPLSKNRADHERRQSSGGYLGNRFQNARGEGVNGITYTVTLTPTLPGSAVQQTGIVSQDQGGEAGWSSAFLGWISALPGGTWTKTVVVTAPADIDNAAHSVLAAGENSTYTLIAQNDKLKASGLVGVFAAPDRHINAGDTITFGCILKDSETGKPVAADSDEVGPLVWVAIMRPHPTKGLQFLNAASAWEDAYVGGVPVTQQRFRAASFGAAAPTVYVKNIVSDASWLYDVAVLFTIEQNGFEYSATVTHEIVGPHHNHGIAEIGGGSATLNDLTDVDTTGAIDGYRLVYDAASNTWKPAHKADDEFDPTGLFK